MEFRIPSSLAVLHINTVGSLELYPKISPERVASGNNSLKKKKSKCHCECPSTMVREGYPLVLLALTIRCSIIILGPKFLLTVKMWMSLRVNIM